MGADARGVPCCECIAAGGKHWESIAAAGKAQDAQLLQGADAHELTLEDDAAAQVKVFQPRQSHHLQSSSEALPCTNNQLRHKRQQGISYHLAHSRPSSPVKEHE